MIISIISQKQVQVAMVTQKTTLAQIKEVR